ncbi:MAG: hypothetical protein M3444_04800 [Acidobacteriota bacterium]|nr:hypothetical protein [Acidobacteriota bacterium]
MTPGDGEEKDDLSGLPEHLRRWPGLYVREGERIVEASPRDVAVAKSYPRFPDKGPVVDGVRITILTESTAHKVGDEVRVIHVVEFTEPGRRVYVMGPKPVYGETVNGELVAEPSPAGDPLVPAEYSGATLPSPAVDYNYDITSYTFDAPGEYRIQWQPGSLESNTLAVTVGPAQ